MVARTVGWTAVALVLLTATGGCCEEPWNAYPSEVPPDRSCRTGSVSGYDVYIWECRNDQREVVYYHSAEMSCSEPQKETAPCGERTPIEEELGDKVDSDCESVPETMRWKTNATDGFLPEF